MANDPAWSEQQSPKEIARVQCHFGFDAFDGLWQSVMAFVDLGAFVTNSCFDNIHAGMP
jgi:hypothetical protein